MPPIAKLICGLLATVLLGWFFHGPAGFGRTFMDGVLTRGQESLSGIDGAAGVRASIDDTAAYRRVIMLDGPVSDVEKKDSIRRAVIANTPGAYAARWVEAGSATSRPVIVESKSPATAAQVASCQSGLDAAIKGKVINFSSGGSVLTTGSIPVIDAVAGAMANCAGTRVKVTGHTDMTGGTAQNQRLSEERANAVVAALVERGIPIGRVQPEGKGETSPVAPGANPEVLARNRRIEFSAASAS